MSLKSAAHYRKQRDRVWARDKGRCVVCGRTGTQVHHRRGRGGPDPHSMENLLLVDDECHRRIHGNPAWSYENGFMVRKNGVLPPERVPVIVNSLPVWLTPDGLSHPQKEDHGASVLS